MTTKTPAQMIVEDARDTALRIRRDVSRLATIAAMTIAAIKASAELARKRCEDTLESVADAIDAHTRGRK